MRRRVRVQIYLASLLAFVAIVIGFLIVTLFFTRMKTAGLNAATTTFDRISTISTQRIVQLRLEIGYQLALAGSGRLARAETFTERFNAKGELRPLLNASPLVISAFVGYPNGDFLLLRKAAAIDKPPAEAAFVVRSVDETAGGPRGKFWFYDARGKLIASRDVPSFRFDPRTQQWFRAGTNDVTVTPPFLSFALRRPTNTVSQRSRTGSVFAVDVDVFNLSVDLARVLPTRSALGAIVSPNGSVLAFSDVEKYDAVNFRNGERPATIHELGSPQLSAAFEAASQRPGFEATGTYRDANGETWLYSVTAPKDASGKTVLVPTRRGRGVVNLPRNVMILSAPEDELIADALRLRNEALVICLVLILVMIPSGYWLSRVVSQPLGHLRVDALALRNLDFSERPQRDSIITEVDEFSQTFGAMRLHIRDHNDAVTRFIPREFLEQLGHRDITGLRLGDHHENVMTILFSDIRAFTTLSGSMTTEETFKFVNSYLTQIGPIIREQHGFIDKYIGDAIFALFPSRPDTAVDAAIAMQRRLVTYNEGRARAGYAPIAIGIGIHRGNLMLGTIGESQRFETTVISDAVNIASRMESLTKTFGVLILATSTVMDEVDRTSYQTRRLGEVLVKGATHAVTVYEVCDADPPELLAHKMRTGERFDAGRRAYAAGDFAEAYRIFSEVAENEDDHAAAYFRDRSAIIAALEEPPTWDGVEHMETK